MENREELGFRFSQGGEAELEEVMNEYSSVLFHYCFNTVCDYHAAEDILQQVFIKAYKNRKNFRADSKLSTWLYRIAYNSCIDYMRRKKFTLPLWEVKETAYIDEGSIGGGEEFNEEVTQALRRLTPKERAIVYGRTIEEKSYQELAEISDISEAALRKRYMRAKRKLADLLRSSDTLKGRIRNEIF